MNSPQIPSLAHTQGYPQWREGSAHIDNHSRTCSWMECLNRRDEVQFTLFARRIRLDHCIVVCSQLGDG